MELQDLLQEVLDEGFKKVWLFRTYGFKDDDGNSILLDLFLDHTGEEIARRAYWPDQTGHDWKMTIWGMMHFGSLPASAVEIDVATSLLMLAIGIEADTVLGSASDRQ